MSINAKILRQAQLIMLEMLVEFDAICEKHDLRYWLDSGTLLGAVRHQGFIPWDDDIDLSMPVEDYNKFKEIAKEELSSNIFYQTKETDKDFLFDYIKLRSNKASIVEFHEKDKNINYHQGVFIDIFPMRTLANTLFNKKYYTDVFKLIRDTSAVSLHTPDGHNLPQSRKNLVDSLSTLHEGWGNKNNKVIYGGEMPDVAAWFDQDKIFPLKKITFEGKVFFVPKDPDHYLSNNYSFDYMQVPPLEKRTIHAHEVIINS